LLELAGAWEEPKPKAPKPQMPTSKPGTEPRSGTEPRPGNDGPLPNPVLPEPSGTSDEDLLRDAIAVIRKEQKASARVLMRGLGLGYLKADRVLAELERRGVIGPAHGNQPRAILTLPSAAKAAESGPASDSSALEPENVGIEGQGSDDRGAAAGPTAPDVVAQCSGPAFMEGAPTAPNLGLASESPQAGASSPPTVPAAPCRGSVAGPKAEELAPGFTALRYFFERLKPTWEQKEAYLLDGPLPDPLPTARLREVRYRTVSLLKKRGLTRSTCELLGFMANSRDNEKVLREMERLFDWDERLASGLWKEASLEHHLDRRPDSQFYGKGQVGKKPEEERRDEDDKWQWGWCEPPHIPYFDEVGKLVKLRPHKGGARSGTAAGSDRIYVPRAYKFCAEPNPGVALPPEKFSTVIICEGEFKAAAIWQFIGAGGALLHGYQTPVGVCALPGISFARNEDYREDLEEWLRAVECDVVKVAFDDEDKSHKPLRQRFDSVIFAQYLATDLARKLSICGKYCPLPKAWRNDKGKADWDGAAAMIWADVEKTWRDDPQQQHLVPGRGSVVP